MGTTLWTRADLLRVRVIAYVLMYIAALAVVFALIFSPLALWAALLVDVDNMLALTLRYVGVLALAFLVGLVIWVTLTLDSAGARAARRLGAVPAAAGELSTTRRALHDAQIAAGLSRPPQLWLIDESSVNAFVVGTSSARLEIGVTRGLAEGLSQAQQRAVLASLMSRATTGDLLWVTILMHAQTLLDLPGKHRVAFLAFVVVMGRAAILAAYLPKATGLSFRQLHAAVAERGDAAGLLLLREPEALLSALDRTEDAANHITTLPGPALGPLFFSWPDTYAETAFIRDTDGKRMERLREVAGLDARMGA